MLVQRGNASTAAAAEFNRASRVRAIPVSSRLGVVWTQLSGMPGVPGRVWGQSAPDTGHVCWNRNRLPAAGMHKAHRTARCLTALAFCHRAVATIECLLRSSRRIASRERQLWRKGSVTFAACVLPRCGPRSSGTATARPWSFATPTTGVSPGSRVVRVRPWSPCSARAGEPVYSRTFSAATSSAKVGATSERMMTRPTSGTRAAPPFRSGPGQAQLGAAGRARAASPTG